jgi:PAS domain S-box-containing protein
MAESNRESLRDLLRRAEEVRGLSHGTGQPSLVTSDDTAALVQMTGRLVDDLESAQRRLIESHVQLSSLREVASSLAGTRDAAEATRRLTRYLRGVLDFAQVGLLLVDRDRGVLTGTWAHGGSLVPVEVPLVGSGGALPRALWQDRAVQHHDPAHHPALVLPEGHPLARVFAEQSWYTCVPLERASASATGAAPEACANCPARARSLVPPPGADVAAWRAEVEAAQRTCVGCAHLPLLGVLAAARGAGAPPPPAGERTRLEAVAFTIAPMVVNARLVHDLARNERFLADVLDSMPSALVAFDNDGAVLSLNANAQELLWLDEEAARGRTVDALFGTAGERLIRDTLATGRPTLRHELVLDTPAGRALPVRLTTSQLCDEHGRAYGAIATFLDLTPLRAAEERARQLDQLAALGRFTTGVAHEIRNPLTGIGMGVKRLARVLKDQPAELENLDFVQREIRRLDGIVQQLFDVTHPRKLDLAPKPLAETLRRAAQSVAGVLEERGMSLEWEPPVTLPPVPHDADQMQQVFINLLKNAAEASPEGSRITVRVTAPDGPDRPVVTTVTDQGSGIDAETQKTLFEPFFTTKPKGTGLGLYITHDIVKRHGGSLTVQSAPGQGATFTVELPRGTQGGAR